MGRKPTERQLARRAANRAEHKEREELGPLFADQAVRPDETALMYERRAGWSVMNEHNERRAGGELLDGLHEGWLRNQARRHIDPETFRRLWDYRNRTYPPSATYGVPFWKGVLCGKRVVFSWRTLKDPTVKLGGKRTVEDGVLPPDGWCPPFTQEQLASYSWSLCKACRMWHAPGQTECFAYSDAMEDMLSVRTP